MMDAKPYKNAVITQARKPPIASERFPFLNPTISGNKPGIAPIAIIAVHAPIQEPIVAATEDVFASIIIHLLKIILYTFPFFSITTG